MGRPRQIGARVTPTGKCSMRLPRWCDRLFMAIMLLASMSPALAFPPPPDKPPLLRQASMTVTVTLVEAANGQVFRITELCKVSGKIPVYADDGNAAYWYLAQIHGCHMLKKGKKLPVAVSGVMAVAKKNRHVCPRLCGSRSARCCSSLPRRVWATTAGEFRCRDACQRFAQVIEVQVGREPRVDAEREANGLARRRGADGRCSQIAWLDCALLFQRRYCGHGPGAGTPAPQRHRGARRQHTPDDQHQSRVE